MDKEIRQIKRPNSTLIEDVVFKYLPFWPLFLLLSIIFLAGSWMYLKTTQPVYEATATILLSDQSKGSDQNQVSESLNLPTTKNVVENELEVLHSRKLMEQVVTELHLYAPIYKKGKYKDSIPAYSQCPVSIQCNDPENIRPARKIPFTVNLQTSSVTIKNNSYPLNQFVATPYGNLNFVLKNKNALDSAVTYLFTLQTVKNVANGNLKALEVTASGKVATVVKLKMLDQEPRRAEDILNTLLVKYTQASIDYKNQLAKNTITFIDARLNILTNNIKDVEKQVQNYKASNGIVNLDDQGKIYMQSVSQNDQRLADINLQLSALNQVEKYVASKDNSQGIVPASLGVNDPMLTKLLDRLYDEEVQYDKLKKTAGENNPLAQTAAKQIESIRPSILENIRNQKASLEIGRNNITNSLNSYNSVLTNIPRKEKGLIDITRDQTVKNSTYAFLLEKREQAALTYSSTVPDSKIVDTAESSTLPVAPKKSIFYLIALGAAAALTLAYILLKEMINGNVLFRKEIEQSTDLPVAGEVAYYGANKNNLVAPENVQLQRQLSKIITTSGLAAHEVSQKILVTSASDGEGKSFFASNLAENLAASGKRVLLVDADFDSGNLSKWYKVSGEKGLSDYLSGSLDEGFPVSSTTIPGLSILSAGNNLKMGSRLLGNGKFASLIHLNTSKYDCIIIDSSSQELNGDAGIIALHTNRTFYIVRHNVTSKASLKQIDYNPLTRSFKNLYIVFNGVKKRGILLRNKSFGYGYEKIA